MTKQSNKSPFFFVNKTPGSNILTRSYEMEERTAILSHVQTRRRRKAKGDTTPEPWARFSSNMIFLNGIAESSTRIQAEAESKSSNRRPAHSATEDTSLTLLTQYPTNNEADPFHCTVVGTDAYTHAMLQYAFSSMAKKTFLAEAFAMPYVLPAARVMRHAQILGERLKHCVHNEMLMYSTLAYGSSCLAWSTGKYEDICCPNPGRKKNQAKHHRQFNSSHH